MSSFHEIIGQRRPIQILQSFLVNKAVPNVLLFAGDEGIGKRTTAITFVRTLLCLNVSQEEGEANPCNTCLSCQKIDHGNHPDFTILTPPEAKSAGGSIPSIPIEEIRALQKRIVFEPTDGKQRVILIVPAEKMTAEAQNAMLKTLEEPPTYVVFILVCSKPSQMLPTIVSRCQKVSFSPLSLSQIESILMDRKAVSTADARLLASLTGGKLGEALSLEVETARALEEDLNSLVKEETVSHYDTLFETAVRFSADAETLETALSYLSAYFRDLLVLHAVPDGALLDPSYLVFSWRRDELLAWSRRMNADEVGRFLADMAAIQQALARNINRQLVLETLLMKMRDKLVMTP